MKNSIIAVIIGAILAAAVGIGAAYVIHINAPSNYPTISTVAYTTTMPTIAAQGTEVFSLNPMTLQVVNLKKPLKDHDIFFRFRLNMKAHPVRHFKASISLYIWDKKGPHQEDGEWLIIGSPRTLDQHAIPHLNTSKWSGVRPWGACQPKRSYFVKMTMTMRFWNGQWRFLGETIYFPFPGMIGGNGNPEKIPSIREAYHPRCDEKSLLSD